MKRNFWNFLIVLFVSFVGVFVSCNDDDDDDLPISETATIFEENGNVVTITDLGEGVGNYTFTADKVWVLNGLVFVNEGQTLTIEPGTVIKGKAGQLEDASALVVARGAKIMAEGTSTEPIIFTAEVDQLNGNIGIDQRGLWGGLIILGNAKLNSTPGETAIEGIPTTEPRGLYGGNNDADNSGVLRYVSIRHGGTDIGEGNEINGLTLGGVGSATTIEYIEVIANKDDGIEFFGGAPRLKYIVVSYCGDDSFDYDEGYRGKGQFWLAIQDVAAGDRLGEHDGGTNPETAQPYAEPFIYNATYIGRGAEAGKRTITFRDNAGGHYVNSIFAFQKKGIDVEILASQENSYNQMVNGLLEVKNCIFSDVADMTGNGIFKLSYVGDSINAAGEPVMNPEDIEVQLPTVALLAKVAENQPIWQAKFDLWNNSATTALVTAQNPVPASGANNPATPTDSWFTTVSYQGAFEPAVANHWAKGWTKLFE